MIFEIKYSGSAGLDLIQAETRADAERILREHWENFQSFTVPETGSIQVYAVELSEQNKRTAALYYDDEDQFIWLHCAE